jgi:dipeptidyl aminopeptidase/acylaminoacyl peptidase
MMTVFTRLLTCCVASTLSVSLYAQQTTAISPSDCVRTKYLTDDYAHTPIQFNPQGTMIAYIVKAPDLEKNVNEMQLFVQHISSNSDVTLSPLLVGTKMKALQWIEHGRRIAVLMKQEGTVSVVAVSPDTGKTEVLAKTTDDIVEYAIDATGDILAFATEHNELLPEQPKDISAGQRISFTHSSAGGLSNTTRMVFLSRRENSNSWSFPVAISFRSAFTTHELKSLLFASSLFLSLSPDGQYLTVSYMEPWNQLPVDIASHPFAKLARSAGYPGLGLTIVRELNNSQRTLLPGEIPFAQSVPIWSPNSTSFALNAFAPFGSEWEVEDIKNNRISFGGSHIFSVDPRTSKILEVSRHIANPLERPLAWTDGGELIIHPEHNTVRRVALKSGGWQELSSYKIPLPGLDGFTELASNGLDLVGDYQATSVPPELFLYDMDHNTIRTVAHLNPQYSGLTLARAEAVHWKTSTGYGIDGLLLYPPDYVKGEHRPLVIQTKQLQGGFVCDTGTTHYPSFAPQPIADAGIFYLIRKVSEGTDDSAHYPPAYPGGIAEAVLQTDIWDSAVQELTAQGLVDPTKVGIIGFSRSGWFTEFALVHGKTKYRAATATDNVQYALGEYWYMHSEAGMLAYDLMYGGPPYGPTLKNWLDYSISFNLDKIHTPLLMEQMGYGEHYDDRNAPPVVVALSFEVFAGLSKLRKPVELYYYPDESHMPDDPRARLGSLQRNLDWYRFWLQGYERANPEDSTQYDRWKELLRLQEASEH